MRVIACHPEDLDGLVEALTGIQARVDRPPGFDAWNGWLIKGAEQIEDVVADPEVPRGCPEIREVAA